VGFGAHCPRVASRSGACMSEAKDPTTGKLELQISLELEPRNLSSGRRH